MVLRGWCRRIFLALLLVHLALVSAMVLDLGDDGLLGTLILLMGMPWSLAPFFLPPDTLSAFGWELYLYAAPILTFALAWWLCRARGGR